MKKIMLMLLLLITTPVFAKQYTEYSFVGYEQEKPLVDELTKYEEVYLHRYYRLKEGPKELIDKYDPKKDTFDHCSDKPTSFNKVFDREASEHYDNRKYVLIKSPTNAMATEVRVENIDQDLLTIKKVEILIKNELAYTVENENSDDQIFTQNLSNIDIDDIEVLVYYEATSNGKFIFTLGGTRVSTITNVEKGYEYSSYRAMSPEKHTEFVETNGFNSQKILHYYSYTEEKYLCYNDEREYYEDSIEDELEGYIYDPLEDKKIYKVYKREEIEESVEPVVPIEPVIPTEPIEPIVPTKPVVSTTPENKAPTLPIEIVTTPSETVVKPSTKWPNITSTDKQESLTKPITYDDTSKEDEKPIYETDKDSDRIAYGDTNQSNVKNESLNKDLKNDTDEKKETDIKLIKYLILIVLVLTIIQTIHLICVNKED